MENYVGVKFKGIPLGKLKNYDEKILEIIKQGRLFWKKGWVKDREGNISMRCEKMFLITRSGASLKQLSKKDFSLIKEVRKNENEIYFYGNIPSSETPMHHSIYLKNEWVKVVVHLHNDEILKKVKWDCEGSYGSWSLAERVAEIIRKGGFCVIKNHGFVFAGKSWVDVVEMVDNITG